MIKLSGVENDNFSKGNLMYLSGKFLHVGRRQTGIKKEEEK